MKKISYSLLKKKAIENLHTCEYLGFCDDILRLPEINAPTISVAERVIDNWPVDRVNDLLRLFPSIAPINWQSRPLDIVPAEEGDWEISLIAS